MSVRDRIKRMEQMAMQEREAAPDERGRSPGALSMASNTSASGSPRPLPKVRTSFVAIADKEGRIGLARQASGESSLSRKLSGDTDAAASTSSSLLDHNTRPNVFSSSPDAIRNRGPSGSSVSSAALQNAGPGSATEHSPAGGPFRHQNPKSPGSISGSARSDTEPGAAEIAKPAEHAQSAGLATDSGDLSSSENTKPGPFSDPKLAKLAPSAGLGAGASGQKAQDAQEAQKGLAASPQITEASQSQAASGRTGGSNGSNGSIGGYTSQGQSVEESKALIDGVQGLARNQAQSKGSKEGSEGSEETSDRAKDSPKGDGRAGGSGAAPALNGADKAKTTKPAPASSTLPKPAGKTPVAKDPIIPAVEKKPSEQKTTEKKAAPSNISPRFVKPRPKSPTQPVKLPERLTTLTAASAAKTKNGAPPPAHRPASTTSGRGVRSNSISMKGSLHSSFGPPPKQSESAPKDSRPVDEGFLARMMRPTQAYAAKVADKSQLPPKTPPHTTSTRKPVSTRNGPVKKAPKSAATSATASPETSKSGQTSTVKKNVVKKVQKPIAEEPLLVAKRSAPIEKVSNQEEQNKEPVKANVSFSSFQKDTLAKESEKENKALKPANDLLLASFMNPGSEKNGTSQVNGNHTEKQEEQEEW